MDIKTLLNNHNNPNGPQVDESYDFIRGQKLAGILNEIDWEEDFADVKKTCLSIPQLVDDLQRILDRKKIPANKRDKARLDKAIVHNKTIQQTEGGDIDVQAFIDDITKMPSSIVSQNGKMAKTSKGNVYVVNTGIPALNGIVYDKENEQFFQINTCPGAGTCKLVCYARRGSFVQYDHVSLRLTQRLNLLMNDPQAFEDIMLSELMLICNKFGRDGTQVILRWNDSGDFFSKRYWEIAERITKTLLEKGYDFQSYAYTKIGDYVNLTDDILTNFSRGANKRETGKVDIEDVKQSIIVEKEFFKDLFVRQEHGARHFVKGEDGKPIFVNEKAKLELKKRLSQEYGVPLSSVKYINELPSEQGKDGEFNVIVLPFGDSDEPAHRKDVKITFLLIH